MRLGVFPCLIIALLSVGMFVGMLTLKTTVQQQVTYRATLLKNQAILQNNIRVLRAEYAYLSRPQRLRALAAQMGLDAPALEGVQTASFRVLGGAE